MRKNIIGKTCRIESNELIFAVPLKIRGKIFDMKDFKEAYELN